MKSKFALALLLTAALTPVAQAESYFDSLMSWDSMGFFSSVDDDTSAGDYTQSEWYLSRDLAWQGTTEMGISYEASLFAGGGMYQEQGVDLQYFTVGPVMRLAPEGSPVKLELGIRPGVLLESESPSRDFGGTITFFDHIGLMWQPSNDITIGYRFQHMSNASIYDTNPGINMHLADMRVSF